MKSPTTFTTAAVTLGLTFLTAASASATVIVSETFGGSSAADLNSTTAATFAAAITTAGGSSTWIAKATDFKADGSVSGSVDGSGRSHLNLGSYINDAKGTANGKFELSATILPVTNASWLSMGFSDQVTPNTTGSFTTGSVGVANMVYRTNGDIDQWAGPGNTNEVEADNITFSGTRQLTITLDLTPLGGYNGTSNFGTARFGANVGVGNSYVEFGSHTYTSTTSFRTILISYAGATVSGSYDSLTLNQIPEPSAALLGGLGMLALLRRRR